MSSISFEFCENHKECFDFGEEFMGDVPIQKESNL